MEKVNFNAGFVATSSVYLPYEFGAIRATITCSVDKQSPRELNDETMADDSPPSKRMRYVTLPTTFDT